MPRRPRILLAGLPVHVIQRGNNRSACFFSEADRALFLHWLQELARRFDCALHAFVLMTNHVHLLLTPGSPAAVSLLMKHLGQRHTQYINRCYDRSGALWEGRFRSCVIEEEAYLLRCYRYIELNPVRAGIASHPREYPWSSYRFNAEGAAGRFLVPHLIYSRLGRSDAERQSAYRDLFDDTLGPSLLDEIRQATNANLALGDDHFRRRVERATGTRAGPGIRGRPRTDRRRTAEEDRASIDASAVVREPKTWSDPM